MGLRVCVAVCTTSFLLGILFTHWIADSLTLWKAPVTNEHIWTAASYYSLFAKAPANLGYALAAVVTLGAATILWSFGDGAAGNLMFDGASIFLYGTAVAVYLYKILPSFDSTFSNVTISPPSDWRIPPVVRGEVLNLASANLVCSVALTGVMALQAARWWAERADPEDEGETEESGEETQSSQHRRRRTRRRKSSKLSASRLSHSASSSAVHSETYTSPNRSSTLPPAH